MAVYKGSKDAEAKDLSSTIPFDHENHTLVGCIYTYIAAQHMLCTACIIWRSRYIYSISHKEVNVRPYPYP